MARLTMVVGVAGMFAARVYALSVTKPAMNEVVQGSSNYTVIWAGVNDNARMEIDLTYCDLSLSYCYDDEDGCGSVVESLCPLGELGCASDPYLGGYQAFMPEPLDGISSSGYRVQIAQVGYGDERIRCSDVFSLRSMNDMAPGMLSVTEPSEDAIAVAGDEYTVEWEYDDGNGNTEDRFKIDLYYVDVDETSETDSMGDCGTWQTSICDKPNIGCHDTAGDYNVIIPVDAPAGYYSIRVGLFNDDAVYDCSDTFEVVV